MKTIADVMTREVRSMRPNDSIVLAAQAMDELDVGALPVCDGNVLVGMLTDRDIVLRGVAQGRDGKETCIREVMSGNIASCFEDQPLAEVLGAMGSKQIRRIPVIDRQQRLVGIVTLGDLVTKAGDTSMDQTMGEICAPSRQGRPGSAGWDEKIPSGVGFV